MMRRIVCLGALLMTMAGCAANAPFASDEAIAAVSYRDPGPATLTLITMVNNRTGGGGHSALMINASERVIFDPAGSFYLDIVPERNDVLYGITPRVFQGYKSAHARSTFHVVTQTVEVSPAQAQAAYQLALQSGPVAGAFCSNATSALLQKVPGFQDIRSSMQPTRLSEQFERYPGVVTEKYYENDSADLQQALAEGNAKLVQE